MGLWASEIEAEQGTVKTTTSNDPAINAAVSTAIVDAYSGVIITTTAAGNSQTIQDPTSITTNKEFIVANNDASTDSITVNSVVIEPGEAQKFYWDGSAWLTLEAISASQISFTPTGDIVATDVQSAIGELDTEKISIATMTGLIGDIGNPIFEASLNNSLVPTRGVGSITFVRSGAATHIDRYGVVQDLASGEAGFDVDGLDLPPASTNLLTYSQDFSNAVTASMASIVGTGTATDNNASAPDGTITACLLSSTDTDVNRAYFQYLIPVADDSVTRTTSIFLKAGTSATTRIDVYYIGGTTVSATSTITWATKTATAGTVEELANGWIRYQIPLTNNSTGNAGAVARVYPDGSIAGASGTVYSWGWQVEALPFATPYIPTTTAPVARLGATAIFPYAENFPGSLADKTVVFDVNVIGTSAAYAYAFASGDLLLLISWSVVGDGNNVAYMTSGSTTPVAAADSGSFRFGCTYNYSTTTLRAYINGILVGEDTTANASEVAGSTITLGCPGAYIKIKNLRIYDKCLTEEQMRIS